MTWSEASKCPECDGPLAVRQAYPYPVLLQVLFAASFVIFLLSYEHLHGQKVLIWGWSALQILLGGLLVRGRWRARVRVYRCIRCSAAVR